MTLTHDDALTKYGRLCIVQDVSKNGRLSFSQMSTAKAFETQQEWNGKWNKDTLTYAVVRDTEDIEGTKSESIAMALALTTYAVEIPIKFKRVKASENPDLRIEFKSKAEEPQFRDRPSTLAFAYFPAQGVVSGSVVFNDEYLWSLDGNSVDNPATPNPKDRLRTYNIIHVLIHELGHSLGLRHDENNDTKDVMDPYYDGKVLELSPNDIIRIRAKYGIRVFKNWSRYTRIKNWLFHRKRRF